MMMFVPERETTVKEEKQSVPTSWLRALLCPLSYLPTSGSVSMVGPSALVLTIDPLTRYLA